MATFSIVVTICSGVLTILGLLTIFIKPIREKILKTKQHEDEQNKKIGDLQNLIMASSLDSMTRIYYDAMENKKIKQYHYESFCNIYDVYKANGGNHWSTKMFEDLKTIEVIPN